ncbi:MAG: hypothetical protein HQL32_15815, partial [Planctomycetes bacterium]|nr:hypothetical protein [Planctomycetota bacterium]
GIVAISLHLLTAAPKPQKVGMVKTSFLKEISGLAVSRTHDNTLWAVNDSGNRARLYAIEANGNLLGYYKVGAQNFDWEDMGSFIKNGQSWLMIADVGDNKARRDNLRLLFFPEPQNVPHLQTTPTLDPFIIPFRYDDGPRDCEAVCVSDDATRVYFLSKRDQPPRLYQLNLKWPLLEQADLKTAKFIGALENIPAPSAQDLKEEYGKYRSQPTSMDMIDNKLIVLTYKHAYHYCVENIGRNRIKIPAPFVYELPSQKSLPQREALAISKIHNGFYVTSERENAGIYWVDFRDK